MQNTANEIIETIKTLPIREKAKVYDWLEEEKKRKKSKSSAKDKQTKYLLERYKKARKWLDEHSEEYMNQWVCLEGDKLIAHGNDGMEVHRKAKEAGIEIPFVHHIVPEIDMGGW